MAAIGGRAKRVAAIMQPYFAPYPGYYRLLAAADIFVVYDCVQFPRRGWVHRNRLADAHGEPAWLTLPLESAPFDALISALSFADDAETLLAERLRVFPSLAKGPAAALAFLAAAAPQGSLVDYLERQLQWAADAFGFRPEIVRSSAFGLGPDLRGQDRILELCRRVGATDYVNAAGGVELYDPTAFAAFGLDLHFLPSWTGETLSILESLAARPRAAIAEEIRVQTPAYSA